MNERIVKKIAELVRTKHSMEYIEAYVWAMRTPDTSLADIDTCIQIFRLFYKEERTEE